MAFGKNQDHASGVFPECGAIFMSNHATKNACFTSKCFALPSSYSNFVNQVKAGMLLFLFEYEKRELYGVYQACTNGTLSHVPKAVNSVWHQFPAQVKFKIIWLCMPLPEREFRPVIKDNYFSAKKFNFGLSKDQVRQLLLLFSDRKIKDERLTRPIPGRDHCRSLETDVMDNRDEHLARPIPGSDHCRSLETHVRDLRDERLRRPIPGSDHGRSLETHVTKSRALDNDGYDSVNEIGRKYIDETVNSPIVLAEYNETTRNMKNTFDGAFMGNDMGITHGVVGHEAYMLSNRFGITSTRVRLAGDGQNHTGDFDRSGQNAAVNFKHTFSVGCSSNSSPAVGRELLTRYAAECVEDRAGCGNMYYDKLHLGWSKDLHSSTSGMVCDRHVDEDVLTNFVQVDHDSGSSYRPIISDTHLQSCHADRNPSKFASSSIYETDSLLLHIGARESSKIHAQARKAIVPSLSYDPVTSDFHQQNSHSEAIFCRTGCSDPKDVTLSCTLPADVHDFVNPFFSHDLSHHTSPGKTSLSPLKKLSIPSYVEPDSPDDGSGRSPSSAALRNIGHICSSQPPPYHGVSSPNGPFNFAKYSESGVGKAPKFEKLNHMPYADDLPVSESSVGYEGNGGWEGISLLTHESSSIMHPLPVSDLSVDYRRNGRREGMGLSAHEPSSIIKSHGSEFVHSSDNSYNSDPVLVELRSKDTLRSNIWADEVHCHPSQGKPSLFRTRFFPEIASSHQERKFCGSVYSDSVKEHSVFSRLSSRGIEPDKAEQTDQERGLRGSLNYDCGKVGSIFSRLSSVDIDADKADCTDRERRLRGSVKLDSRKDDSVFSRLSSANNDIEEADHSGHDNRNIDLMVDEVMEMLTNHYHTVKKAHKRKPLARSDDDETSRLGKQHTLPEDRLIASTYRNLDGDKIEVDGCKINVEKPQISFKRRSEIQRTLLENDVNSFVGGSRESVTEKQSKRRRLVRPSFGNEKTLFNEDARTQGLANARLGKDASQSTGSPVGGCSREHDSRVTSIANDGNGFSVVASSKTVGDEQKCVNVALA